MEALHTPPGSPLVRYHHDPLGTVARNERAD